jgi:hypothetical protein
MFRNMISLTFFSSYKSRKGILHFSLQIIKTIIQKDKIFLLVFFQVFFDQSLKSSLIKLFLMIPPNHTFTPIYGFACILKMISLV